MTEQPKYHCNACKRQGITGVLAVRDFHHQRKDVLLAIGAGLVILGLAVLIGLGVWAVSEVLG